MMTDPKDNENAAQKNPLGYQEKSYHGKPDPGAYPSGYFDSITIVDSNNSGGTQQSNQGNSDKK
jgi:hypothetical protein